MTIYHRLYQRIMESPKGFFSEDDMEKMKEAFRASFSWCIPNQGIMTLLKMYSPIVEVGAGSGYWAWEMRKSGIHVDVFDPNPERIHDWVPYIIRAMAGDHTGRDSEGKTLLIVSPQYRSDMAYQALKAHKGIHFIYVGTPKLEMNCGEEFTKLLEREFKKITIAEIPNWLGEDNVCFVYERKHRWV